ncbi:hypothetical protein RJ641_007109 [Dillenia turbinata]|uniref:Uncharacterized protein n=1 Tax=Dillenia turbinata TaxID=194707 RepID=A0AAN8ZCE8_9MAGN
MPMPSLGNHGLTSLGMTSLSTGKIMNRTSFIVSNSHLSGEIPLIWDDKPNLYMVDMADNSLSGQIPSSWAICSLSCSWHQEAKGERNFRSLLLTRIKLPVQNPLKSVDPKLRVIQYWGTESSKSYWNSSTETKEDNALTPTPKVTSHLLKSSEMKSH